MIGHGSQRPWQTSVMLCFVCLWMTSQQVWSFCPVVSMARYDAPSSQWPKAVGQAPANSRRIVVTHMVSRWDPPYDPRFAPPPQDPEEEEEKPGFLGRLFNVFRRSPPKDSPRQAVDHFQDFGRSPTFQSPFPPTPPPKPAKENNKPAPRPFRTGIPIVDFVLRRRAQQSQPSSPSPQKDPSHFSVNDEARIQALREKLYREMKGDAGDSEARNDLDQFSQQQQTWPWDKNVERPNTNSNRQERLDPDFAEEQRKRLLLESQRSMFPEQPSDIKQKSAQPPSQSSGSIWKRFIPRNPTDAELHGEQEDDISDRMPSEILSEQIKEHQSGVDLAADFELALKNFNEQAIREGKTPLRRRDSPLHDRSRDEEKPKWTLEDDQELERALEDDPEFRDVLLRDEQFQKNLAEMRKEAGLIPPEDGEMFPVQTKNYQREKEFVDAEVVDPRKARADSAMRRPLRTETEWQLPQERRSPTPMDRESDLRRILSSPHEEEGDSLGHMWSKRLAADNGPPDRTLEASVSTPSTMPHLDEDHSVSGVGQSLKRDYSFEDLPDETQREPVNFDRKFGFAENFQDEHISEGNDDRAWWESERRRWKKEAEAVDQDQETPFEEELSELSVAKVNLEAARYQRRISQGEEVNLFYPDRHYPMSEHGAIFRLEGVLIDVTGLHLEAWKSVAKYYEYAAPDIEAVRAAAVCHPYYAIENIFHWSRIPEKTEEIAAYFQRCFKRATQAWEDVNESWRQTAVKMGKSPPTNQQLENASILSPRDMIKQELKWAKDEDDVDDMVALFSEIAQSNGVAESYTSSKKAVKEEPETPLLYEDPLVVQLDAWITVASMYSLKVPSLEDLSSLETLSAEDTAKELFKSEGLSDKQLGDIAQTYEDALKTKRSPGVAPTARPLSEDRVGRLIAEVWAKVAKKCGKAVPEDESLSSGMIQFPEVVVRRVLKWTNSEQEAQKIADVYRDYINVKRLDLKMDGEVLVVARQSELYQDDGPIPFVTVNSPTAEWISDLKQTEVECSLVSYMSRGEMEKFIRFAKLEEVFPPETRVSAYSRSEQESHHLLEASLYIHRRPDHCIMFDTTPHASSLARELGMKSVSVSGAVPHYELTSSDMVVDSLIGMPFINLRSLFGKEDEPETEPVLQRVTKPANGNNNPRSDWDEPLPEDTETM